MLPGIYRLEVSYKNQNTKTKEPDTKKNTIGPTLDFSSYIFQPSGCVTRSGYIKKLKVTGTGTIKFSWTNEQQQEVATTLDLTDQPAGTYTLHVSDDSKCDPVIQQFEIPDIVGVYLSTGQEKITAATCGEVNGSIIGLLV